MDYQIYSFRLIKNQWRNKMIGKANTFSRMGMYCNLVEVEVDIKNGLPNIFVTGMLSQEVRESRERVRPAIINSGFEFPIKRITINLAPAETIKNGTHYDLAIAIAILKATGYIDESTKDCVYFGELNLSGDIKWIRGILPMVIEALNYGFNKIFIPHDNYKEVSYLNSNAIFPVKSLKDIVYNIQPITKNNYENNINAPNIYGDYSDIKGQINLVNAFKIAAAGHHHMLLIGPPGSGKTMAASRLPTIIPDLTDNDILEINKIYSIVSEVDSKKNWITKRPFRSPHNSSSSRAMIGGGVKVLPGEISLAHKGILFLDEFLEFRIDTLQALRTIIEKKEVYISLRNGCAVYPADFLLIAACNPCPCGFYDTENGLCTCSIQQIKKYRKKLKNPLIDRIDLQVKVDRINYNDLFKSNNNKTSTELKKEVLFAREIQKERFKKEKYNLNSKIPAEKIAYYCHLENEANDILEESIEKNLLTARACHKILRIARTIADINQHGFIMKSDLKHALNYRFLDGEII